MSSEWVPGVPFVKKVKGDTLLLDAVGTSDPFKIAGDFQVFNAGITYYDYFPCVVGEGEDDNAHVYYGSETMSPRTTFNNLGLPSDEPPQPNAYFPSNGVGYSWEIDDNYKMSPDGWNFHITDGTIDYTYESGIHSRCYKVMPFEELEPYVDFPLVGFTGTFHVTSGNPYPPVVFDHGTPMFAMVRRYSRHIQLFRIQQYRRKVPSLNPIYILAASLLGLNVFPKVRTIC